MSLQTNPTHQPPSDEAVKAAFEMADLVPMKMTAPGFMEAFDNLRPFMAPREDYVETSARILAAHARAKEAELADEREKRIRLEGLVQAAGIADGNMIGHLNARLTRSESEVERLRAALERIRDHDCNLDAWEVVSAMTNIADEALAGKGEG